MAYTWIGENWGRSLVFDACNAGFTLLVHCEGEELYKGTQPTKAWDAVTSVDECNVVLIKQGCKREAAFIVLEKDQQGDEVINDYTCDGWIDAWWNAKFEASQH